MRRVDIKSVLASTSAESAEVAALEEEMASELAKEAGPRGKGNAQSSPELDESPSITPAPSKHADIDRYYNPHLTTCLLRLLSHSDRPHQIDKQSTTLDSTVHAANAKQSWSIGFFCANNASTPYVAVSAVPQVCASRVAC